MKNIFIIFILFLVIGCGIPIDGKLWYQINYSSFTTHNYESIENCLATVVYNIDYKVFTEVNHPQHYIDTKTADCVGFSLIALGVVYNELGIKGSLLLYHTSTGQDHAALKIKGKEYFTNLKSGKCTDLIDEIDFNYIEYAYKVLY